MAISETLAWMPISLSQGLYALVDGEDYERLNRHKWYANKIGNTFYAIRNTSKQKGKRQMVLMHREVLGLSYGDKKLSDHKNYTGLDNRKQNLRPCTHSQNHQNQKKMIKLATSSKYKGVSWESRRKEWRVRIHFDDKDIYLGHFDDEIKAAEAYDKAAKRLFGEFAKTNF